MTEHVDSVKTYVLVFVGLIILTVVTTAVAFVDLARRAVTARVPVGERPWGIALSADGKALYTADGRAGSVSVLDPRRHRVVAHVPVGVRPYGVLYVGR